LDYCNSLYDHGITDESMKRLMQSVQHAAAWLEIGTRRCDRFVTELHRLRKLPMLQYVDSKGGTLVHRSQSCDALTYLDVHHC
jgi:hypothetical protein